MSVVRPMPDAKPQTPSWTTRTASPTVASSVLDSSAAVAERAHALADPLDPQVGVAAAQLARAAQRRVGQRAQREGREGGVDAA